jgi:signal recognition particle receptor subunit beta
VPFIVAVNSFPDGPRYPIADLRGALDLDEGIPIVECDARRRASSRDTLMTLMRFLHSLALTGRLT